MWRFVRYSRQWRRERRVELGCLCRRPHSFPIYKERKTLLQNFPLTGLLWDTLSILDAIIESHVLHRHRA